jgi:hypothetical protein
MSKEPAGLYSARGWRLGGTDGEQRAIGTFGTWNYGGFPLRLQCFDVHDPISSSQQLWEDIKRR